MRYFVQVRTHGKGRISRDFAKPSEAVEYAREQFYKIIRDSARDGKQRKVVLYGRPKPNQLISRRTNDDSQSNGPDEG